MSHIRHLDQDALIIVAVAVFISAMVCGQLLAGIAGAALALASFAWRRQSGYRRAGNGLILAGFLFVLVGMLFTTGYQLGKDMAHRDNARAAALVHPR